MPRSLWNNSQGQIFAPPDALEGISDHFDRHGMGHADRTLCLSFLGGPFSARMAVENVGDSASGEAFMYGMYIGLCSKLFERQAPTEQKPGLSSARIALWPESLITCRKTLAKPRARAARLMMRVGRNTGVYCRQAD